MKMPIDVEKGTINNVHKRMGEKLV